MSSAQQSPQELQKLRELYYNPKEGFLSLKKLLQRVKEKNIRLSYNDVKNFLARQETVQLTQQITKPTKFSNIMLNAT